MVKPEKTFTWNDTETIFADLNTPNGIITVGLVYKRGVDISTENFSITPDHFFSRYKY